MYSGCSICTIATTYALTSPYICFCIDTLRGWSWQSVGIQMVEKENGAEKVTDENDKQSSYGSFFVAPQWQQLVSHASMVGNVLVPAVYCL